MERFDHTGSLSAGKQDLYIFPIVAATAALGGVTIARGLSDDRWKRWESATLAVAGVLLGPERPRLRPALGQFIVLP